MAKRVKTGGRKKGTPNKTTAIAKVAIEAAAEGLGGADRIIAWAKEDPTNERVFWSQMYTKLLPMQIDADITQNIVSAKPMTPEQWAAEHADED